MADNRTVESGDGTRLSVRVTGSGPPMVLVHGSTGSKDTWALVEAQLASRHAVWVYDRRGRGGSDVGDEGYGLAAEVDDVLAVLAACDGPAHLVSHSFGAVCALEAAARGADLASLTVYEPPVHLSASDPTVGGVLALLRDDDPGGAIDHFLPFAGSSAEEMAMVRSTPGLWDGFVEVAASTLGRELEALATFEWAPARYHGVLAPTLVLAGELTDAPVYASPAELREALPRSEIHVIRGQRHAAMATDPLGFAESVLRFTTQAAASES